LVPTDPIFQARSVFFQEPFSQYSMPKAIIKLKQGFGRLIRSKKDTGVVVLLDDRIFSTTW
jgi:Rad3-related DNA helicase